MLTFLLWIILFVIAWPVAILALILYPIAWLLALPFRLVGISVRAVFDFLGALLGLPARVWVGDRSPADRSGRAQRTNRVANAK